MEKIITVGLDLAKSIFQVHGIAENGKVLVRRTLRRSQVLSFEGSLPAWWVWRLVRVHIIGRARSQRWAIWSA
jgi:hypothetical protein